MISHNILEGVLCNFAMQEPMKSRAPQLHLEYRFYKQLVPQGLFETLIAMLITLVKQMVCFGLVVTLLHISVKLLCIEPH